ncbi:ribonuclease HI [Alphaproteobacteria bacterium]|mgnify:FL=1|jgi:ribonuclease HI|nr:ribonuclease HI [Alphaproteobacteria bacterium]
MIDVYTDGSCLGNPGNGGWAFLVKKNDIISSRSGFVLNTTNNQMELTAAIKAIEFLDTNDVINLLTDSNYVKNGITSWIKNWKINNWKNSSKQPVKNKDLWERLDELNSTKSVNWQWVKAHSTNNYNNQVDLLARQSAESLTESSFDGV